MFTIIEHYTYCSNKSLSSACQKCIRSYVSKSYQKCLEPNNLYDYVDLTYACKENQKSIVCLLHYYAYSTMCLDQNQTTYISLASSSILLPFGSYN